MSLASDVEHDLIAFVSPLYAGRDTMHDWTHIERVRRRALQLSAIRPCNNGVLVIGAYVHGVIYSHEEGIRGFLAGQGVTQPEVDRVASVAWESQKETQPESIEGQILHDAHLLEGDDNFIITKTLVTGSARGQSLAQTLAYFEANVGRHRCLFPENQRNYVRREEIARSYMSSLKSEL